MERTTKIEPIIHVTPKPEEVKILKLIERMNTQAPEGTVFVIYADTNDEGTEVYGIGFSKDRTMHAPLYLFPTCAEVIASITKEQ